MQYPHDYPNIENVYEDPNLEVTSYVDELETYLSLGD